MRHQQGRRTARSAVHSRRGDQPRERAMGAAQARETSSSRTLQWLAAASPVCGAGVEGARPRTKGHNHTRKGPSQGNQSRASIAKVEQERRCWPRHAGGPKRAQCGSLSGLVVLTVGLREGTPVTSDAASTGGPTSPIPPDWASTSSRARRPYRLDIPATQRRQRHHIAHEHKYTHAETKINARTFSGVFLR